MNNINKTLSLFADNEQTVSHEFGGIWTHQKLEILKGYLTAFTSIFSNTAWAKTIYIDSHAGTGLCDIRCGNETIQIPGSAHNAITTSPKFHQIVLIEKDPDKYSQLKKLQEAFPESKIEVFLGDANSVVPEILRTKVFRNHRGVIFLDPYGMNAGWTVLQSIAEKKLDVLYLFPLSGLYRQAAKNYIKLDESKKAAISRILGETDWVEKFYETCPIEDMFGHERPPERKMEVKDFVEYITSRLETIFPYVHAPLILPKVGPPKFALYFALANDSTKAINIAKRVAGHLIKSTG